jgi:hypothetical protein
LKPGLMFETVFNLLNPKFESRIEIYRPEEVET